jgi:hypothetical protein
LRLQTGSPLTGSSSQITFFADLVVSSKIEAIGRLIDERADRLIVEMPLNPAYDLGANVFGHLEYFEQCADGAVRESFEGDWIGDDRVGLKMGAFVQLVERRASDLPDNRSYPPPQRDFLHLVAILRDDKLCQMAT